MSTTTAAVSVAVPSFVEQVISGVRLQAEEALLGTHPAQQTLTSRHPAACTPCGKVSLQCPVNLAHVLVVCMWAADFIPLL